MPESALGLDMSELVEALLSTLSLLSHPILSFQAGHFPYPPCSESGHSNYLQLLLLKRVFANEEQRKTHFFGTVSKPGALLLF